MCYNMIDFGTIHLLREGIRGAQAPRSSPDPVHKIVYSYVVWLMNRIPTHSTLWYVGRCYPTHIVDSDDLDCTALRERLVDPSMESESTATNAPQLNDLCDLVKQFVREVPGCLVTALPTAFILRVIPRAHIHVRLYFNYEYCSTIIHTLLEYEFAVVRKHLTSLHKAHVIQTCYQVKSSDNRSR